MLCCYCVCIICVAEGANTWHVSPHLKLARHVSCVPLHGSDASVVQTTENLLQIVSFPSVVVRCDRKAMQTRQSGYCEIPHVDMLQRINHV